MWEPALAALVLDAALAALALRWWFVVQPARQLGRLLSPVDTATPRFIVAPSLLLPALSNAYVLCRFRVRAGEQWLITGSVPPAARYFSVTLYGSRGRSFDYSQGQSITLNDEQLTYDDPAARTYRISISATRNGAANWLDCSQCQEGIVMIRENGVTGQHIMVPDITVSSDTSRAG